MKETELDTEIKKGKATQDQLRIWDNLLEIRIQMHKILNESNVLPQGSFEEIFQVEGVNEDDNHNSQVIWKNSIGSIKLLLNSLLETQDTLIKQNSEVQKSLLGKRKANEKQAPSDEEITSSEDEKDPDENEQDDDDMLDEEGDEGSEDDIDDEEEDADEESDGVLKKKRKIISDYEAEVQKKFNSLTKFRNETVQKWNEKTQVSSGNFNKRNNFSAFQTTTLSQIEHILKDKTRLVKRTQLKRSNYSVIGKEENESSVNDYDAEIFDDDDFYHQLLREIIDRKTTDVTDPVELSRHWLQIQKLRSKLKRKVDTRASKGRKIRYDVHPKLVNFMASVDVCHMTDNAIKELYSSLFGKHKNE